MLVSVKYYGTSASSTQTFLGELMLLINCLLVYTNIVFTHSVSSFYTIRHIVTKLYANHLNGIITMKKETISNSY